MATGKVVGHIHRISQPIATYPQPIIIAGGSTPAERIHAWAFDPSTVEYLDFLCYLNGYDGGGLTIALAFTAGVTTGNVVWSAAVRRIGDDIEDVDASQTYDYNNASAKAVASASREFAYTTIAFTNGADMDSLGTNEWFILRVRRFASDAGDTLNSNDAELIGVVIKET